MAEKQRWEYMTTFVRADAGVVMEFLQEGWDWKEGIPRNTPEAMIPRLDAYGDQGWELVHMQPVLVGNNADVLVVDRGGGLAGWTSSYFCVFKRPA